MALDKQIMSLNFSQGIDTKTDEKHLAAGKLAVLENAEFNKYNRIDKAKGFTELPTETLGTDVLTQADSLATFGDELLVYQNQKLYAYSSGINKFIDKGTAVSVIVETDQVIKNTVQQTQADFAANNGVKVFAWEDSRGGVRASVFDENSGVSLLTDTVIDASASRVRCLHFSDYLYVIYYKSGSLYARRLNPLSPTAFDAAIELTSGVNTTNPTYDMINYKEVRFCLAYNVQGANQIKIKCYNYELTLLTNPAITTIAEAGTNSIMILARDNSSEIYVAYQNNTNGVRRVIYNNGFGILKTVATVEAITASNVVNMTGYYTSTGVQLLYEVSAASSYNQYIRQTEMKSDGTMGTSSDFARSVGLYSKAFGYTDTDDNTTYYVCCVHDSTLQSTYFVLNSSGTVVAKMQPNIAGGLTTRPILNNVEALSDSKFSWALINKVRIVSENATIFTPKGVAVTSMDFINDDVFRSAELGGNLHIVGGILSMYDGESVVEHGFHLYPENVTLGQSASGGSMSNGTYQVICMYEWTDSKGQVHRSAPSVASSITVSGGGSSQLINVTFPTLRLTEKDGVTRTDVSLVCYRTENNGAIFYRATSITSPTDNDPTADTVTVQLTITDAALISNEILYTTGDVLENEPAPACSSICVFKNRIFLAGLENDNDFWYSKEHVTGRPIEFNSGLKKNTEQAGGRIVTPAVLDDKLVLFKRDRFFITYGDGPNATGQLGDFAQPQFVSADVGCSSSESVVRTPFGIMFKSLKGFYKLDGSLQVTYIGAPVEDFNDLTTTSGNLLAKSNKVIFTHSDGGLLVYDYFFDQWSVRPRLESKDSVIWQDTFVMLQDDRILQSSDTVYKIGDQAQKLVLETGWINIGDITGFQRVWKFFILGEYKSEHKLKVKVAYDYGAFIDTYIFDTTSALGIGEYGDDTPYGSGTPYGGVNSAYRFRGDLSTQKCQAIKFRIEELVTGGTDGSQQGLTISDIGLLVGTARGHAKLRQQQVTGKV